ncbi:MAG: hypothetical protein HY914_20655 [Desulfomonile tiedjei]|nr:hypothetical protein [Desulfomonile tiedjei]
MLKIATAALVIVLYGFVVVSWASPTGKKREKIDSFEVPTTGKIVDVEYRPEFDEWWVKCREGDEIAMYAYEPRSRSWRKVRFIPKKTEQVEARTDKAKEPSVPEKDKQPGPQMKSEPGKPEAKKLPDKDQPQREQKWWSPMKLLERGDKLLLSPFSDSHK